MGYLANGSKFLFPGGEESALPDLLDVYTGKPIRFQEPLTAASNAILPYFKQNGGMEPWRQWLLATGWDGLQKIRINKYTGKPLSSRDRYFINNWMAKNAGLKSQIIQLMTRDDGYFDKKMKEFRKVKSQVPIKEWVVHQELDNIHDRAYKAAWIALENYNRQFTSQGQLLKMRNHELQQGKSKLAVETQKKILQLQQMHK